MMEEEKTDRKEKCRELRIVYGGYSSYYIEKKRKVTIRN